MRLSVPLLSAMLCVAMMDAGSAQATLPNDDVNMANNPGSVKAEPAVKEQALECTCRTTAADAVSPDRNAPSSGETVDCSCRKSVPDTTGTVAGPDAAAPPR